MPKASVYDLCLSNNRAQEHYFDQAGCCECIFVLIPHMYMSACCIMRHWPRIWIQPGLYLWWKRWTASKVCLFELDRPLLYCRIDKVPASLAFLPLSRMRSRQRQFHRSGSLLMLLPLSRRDRSFLAVLSSSNSHPYLRLVNCSGYVDL